MWERDLVSLRVSPERHQGVACAAGRSAWWMDTLQRPRLFLRCRARTTAGMVCPMGMDRPSGACIPAWTQGSARCVGAGHGRRSPSRVASATPAAYGPQRRAEAPEKMVLRGPGRAAACPTRCSKPGFLLTPSLSRPTSHARHNFCYMPCSGVLEVLQDSGETREEYQCD